MHTRTIRVGRVALFDLGQLELFLDGRSWSAKMSAVHLSFDFKFDKN